MPLYSGLCRVVIGVDPAATSSDDSDMTGIVVAGKGDDGRYYVLDDLTMRASPEGWARMVAWAYDEFGADRVVAETNNGGDMVIAVLKQAAPNLPVKKVTATRGKAVRAQPIAMLYEQGRVTHVKSMPELEDQMCSFLPEGNETSPDRVDALVWAMTELTDAGTTGLVDFARAEMERMKAEKGKR